MVIGSKRLSEQESVRSSDIIPASPEFLSSLCFYHGTSFETLTTLLLYTIGEVRYIEHALDTVDWAISVEWAICLHP